MFVSLAFEPIVLIAARALLARGHLAEVFAVVGQAHLLLRDVKFFEVENHLLLQAVRIRLDGKFGQVVENAGPDILRARLFERHHLFAARLDLVHAAQQVGDQDRPLLDAERIEPGHGIARGSHQRGLLLVGDRIVLCGHHVGHAQHGLHQRGVPRSLLRTQPAGTPRLRDLTGIGGERLAVDAGRSLHGSGLNAHEHVDLAPLQLAGDEVAQVVLRTPVGGGNADAEIELLGIERPDFDGELLVLHGGFALAEAGHGFYHGTQRINFDKNSNFNRDAENVRIFFRVEVLLPGRPFGTSSGPQKKYRDNIVLF